MGWIWVLITITTILCVGSEIFPSNVRDEVQNPSTWISGGGGRGQSAVFIFIIVLFILHPLLISIFVPFFHHRHHHHDLSPKAPFYVAKVGMSYGPIASQSSPSPQNIHRFTQFSAFCTIQVYRSSFCFIEKIWFFSKTPVTYLHQIISNLYVKFSIFFLLKITYLPF